MAEVRSWVGRRIRCFAYKICHRNLTKSQNKLSQSAVESCSLSVGFLLGNIQHGGLRGAEKCADAVTGVALVSKGSDTRVTPLFSTVNDVWDKDSDTDYHGYFGPKGWSLFKQSQVQIIKRNRFWRTCCTSTSVHFDSLCNVSGRVLCIRTYSGNGNRSEPLYKTKTAYYEILEVSPTATQSQIKTAYYKQSFVYHPDRNAGSEEATTRFSDISEAYTVLGNKALRKKYDRGLLSQSDLNAAARPFTKDATGSTAKQQPKSRQSVQGEEIRERTFDFDKFYKYHYNEQLQRQRDLRVRREEMVKKEQETMGEKELGRMLEMAVMVLLLMGLGILISLKHG